MSLDLNRPRKPHCSVLMTSSGPTLVEVDVIYQML